MLFTDPDFERVRTSTLEVLEAEDRIAYVGRMLDDLRGRTTAAEAAAVSRALVSIDPSGLDPLHGGQQS